MLPELTLDAAIRDATSEDGNARNLAVRNLAVAYLQSMQLSCPTWNASASDVRGTEIRQTLLRCAEHDRLPQIRGLALIGLGQLGASQLLRLIPTVLQFHEGPHSDETHEGAVFVRECSVIASNLLAQAALVLGSRNHEAHLAFQQACQLIEESTTSPRPELRFQALAALVDLDPSGAENRLLQAWSQESNPQVHSHIIQLLGQLSGPLGQQSLGKLSDFVANQRFAKPGIFDAALCLAAAGRIEAGEPLVYALDQPENRDRALEALAAMGSIAPQSCIPRLRRWAGRFVFATATHVRAAYALARISPDEGLARLNKLAKHPRKSVREAVADAFEGIAQLTDLDDRARKTSSPLSES